ncbi:hypothetical protein [Aeromicrobium sp. CTD01-1L150]|uniref:hypothetical protein n=1 Tax=Aeromicrobium sp. CTD01-1L150 TaxID=3341830 RepID=UPI0035BF47F7
MNPLRKSYEARVLVVPLGSDALELAESLGDLGVDGVQVLSHPDAELASTEVLGQDGWEPPSPANTSQVTQSADMIVLLATDMSAVAEATVREVCAAAREGGDLIAAVLVSPQHWEEPSGASAMVTLRQEVDMLISVRGPRLVAALLDVLRGGAREAATAEEVLV